MKLLQAARFNLRTRGHFRFESHEIPCAAAKSSATHPRRGFRSPSTSTGPETAHISTGVGFFDHMLDQIARHAPLDLELTAKGDLHIDAHHTVEDVGIAFGQAVDRALGDRKGITRYGDAHVPLDEALTRVVVDISGRPFLVYEVKFPAQKIGDFDTELDS